MTLTCPSCGASHPLPELIRDRDYRAAVEAALKMPMSCALLIVRYLPLFSPPKREPSAAKMARVLNGLLSLIDGAKVEVHRRTWAAPLALWERGLGIVLANHEAGKVSLPLSDHGYLCGIVANLANQDEAAREQAAQRPQDGARTGMQPAGQAAEKAVRRGPPPGWRDQALGGKDHE